ncbi:MAG: hypothetical protein P4L53_18490 [Candidatus Obscuribacterales bacterium]|nr:hypothetical protein [Candidatus Obscuribacterales bacterium]
MSADQLPFTKEIQPGDRIAAELTRHENFEHSRSILSKAVDLFYNKDAETLASLKKLQSEVQQSRPGATPDKNPQLDEEVSKTIAADRQAIERKSTISNLATGAVEYAFLAVPALKKARSAEVAVAGLLGTATTWGLAQAKADDTKAHQSEDFVLGAAKGLVTKKFLDVLGTRSQNPYITGVLMGSSSRVADNAFDRNTWSSGLESGVSSTITNSFTADSLKSDFALAGMAFGAHKTLGAVLPGIGRNPVFSNFATGASFGLASGAQSEIHRQDALHENRNWGAVLNMSLAQAGLDGLASVPGGLGKINQSMAARSISAERPMEIKNTPVEEKAVTGMPVSNLLRSLQTTDTGDHNVADYARAMSGFNENATAVRKIGGDSISLDLANGNILKLTTRTLPEQRPFDMPVVDSGTRLVDHVDVNYLVQAKGDTNVSGAQYADFLRDLSKQGYWMSDPGVRNVAMHPEENRVVLVDPWAVERVNAKPAPDSGMIPAESGLNRETVPPSTAQAHEITAPEEIKPFNAFSLSSEPAERLASNFADTPFTFNNRRYKSFESFYQSLKFEDAKLRSEVAKMPGKQAKAAGSKSHATETTFNGKTITLGSPEHHGILEEALFEKFKQNPQAAKALVDSLPRPIIHDTGRAEHPNTFLPADDFTRMLTDVREKLSKMNLDELGKRKK